MPSLREPKQHGTPLYPLEIYETPPHTRLSYVSYHWHEEAEWIHVRQGRLSITIGDQSYTGTAGDLFFIAPEQLHAMSVSGEETDYCALIFPLESLAFALHDAAWQQYLEPLLQGGLLLPQSLPAGEQRQPLPELFSRICRLDALRPYGYELAVRVSLLEILSSLLLEKKLLPGGAAAQAPEEKSRLIRQVLSYLETHYNASVSLSQIAGEFHMSPKYFCFWFRENLGKPFTRYLNDLRLEKAALLLRTTREKVVDIALAVGMENTSYFIRKFKEAYHVTPFQYRQQFLLPLSHQRQ